MSTIKAIFILSIFSLLLLNLGCDNDNSGNASARPSPMTGTDITGKVNAPSDQTCPASITIDGFKAGDSLIVEIDSAQDMTGNAFISNSSESTSAMCSGTTESTMPPATVSMCKVSSSSIPGIKADDVLELDIVFEKSTKEASIENISGPDGIECVFLTIETLNAN